VRRVLAAATVEAQARDLRVVRISALGDGSAAALDARWVLGGVLTHKSRQQTGGAKNGPMFVWTLSDLGVPHSTSVSVFMFDGAACSHALQSMPLGKLLVVQGAKVWKSREEDSGGCALRVTLEGSVRVVGDAEEFSICSARNALGKLCARAVNRRAGELCPEHVGERYAAAQNARMGVASSGSVGHNPLLALGRRVANVSTGSYVLPAAAAAAAPECEQEQDAAIKAGAAGTLAVIGADGRVKPPARRSARPEALCEGSKVLVASMNQELQETSAAAVTRKFSRGVQRAYAGVTGHDLDTSARVESVRLSTELQRSLGLDRAGAVQAQPRPQAQQQPPPRPRPPALLAAQGQARADPLAAVVLAEKQRAEALYRPVAPPPSAAQQHTAEQTARERERALAVAATERAHGDAFQRARLNAARHGAVLSIDPVVAAATQRAQDVVLLRARQAMERKATQAEREAQERAAQQRQVASKLKAAQLQGKQGGSAPPRPGADPLAAALVKEQATAASRRADLVAAAGARPAPSSSSSSVTASSAPGTKRVRPEEDAAEEQKRKHAALQEVLGKRSKHEGLAMDHANEQLFATMEHLAMAEASAEKLALVTEVKVKATTCHECEKTTEAPLLRCQEAAHEMSAITVTKRFFRCRKPGCGERTSTLGQKTCLQTCPQCRGILWEPCSAYGDKKLGIERARKEHVPDVDSGAGAATTFNRR
jgi:hypothetical protein